MARLFPDAELVERDYYRRTGIFPIMHTVVIPRDLLAANPGLARRVYAGFCASRDEELSHLRRGRFDHQINVTMPWFDHLYEANRRLLGGDWWPYGSTPTGARSTPSCATPSSRDFPGPG